MNPLPAESIFDRSKTVTLFAVTWTKYPEFFMLNAAFVEIFLSIFMTFVTSTSENSSSLRIRVEFSEDSNKYSWQISWWCLFMAHIFEIPRKIESVEKLYLGMIPLFREYIPPLSKDKQMRLCRQSVRFSETWISLETLKLSTLLKSDNFKFLVSIYTIVINNKYGYLNAVIPNKNPIFHGNSSIISKGLQKKWPSQPKKCHRRRTIIL